MAWLSVIIIQAVVHFGFLGRNEELKEEGRSRSNEKFADADQGAAPLKTHQRNSVCSEISTASRDEMSDAAAAAAASSLFEDSLFEIDSDSDLKFRIQNCTNETQTQTQTGQEEVSAEMSCCPILSADSTCNASNTSTVIPRSSDSGSSVEGDGQSQSSIEENNSDRKSFERQTSVDTADSSYFGSNSNINIKINSQDESESGLISKSRSHNESLSTVSFEQELLEGEYEDYDCEYDCDDCDSIDEDDEWRLQLLKDYYENATDFLKPVQDDCDYHSTLTAGKHEHAFVTSIPVSAQ